MRLRVLIAALVAPAIAAGLGMIGACKAVPFTAAEGCTMVVVANPTQITATGTSAITVSLLESSGTPVPDGTVVSFTTTLGQVTPEVKVAGGIARATLTGVGTFGTATVTAFSGACGAKTIDVSVGIASESITVAATPANLATGGGSTKITATVFGTGGVSAAGVRLIFTTTKGTLASAGAPATTDANGQAFDTLSTTSTADVTASAGGKTGKVTVMVDSGSSADKILLSANPSSLPITGGSSSISATVLDKDGKGLAGVGVRFTTTKGTLASNTLPVSTDSNGRATDTLTTTETAEVEAFVTASKSSKVTVAISSSADSISLSASPSTLPSAPGTSTLTAVVSRSGLPLAGIPVVFTTTQGTLASLGFPVTTNANGAAVDTLTTSAFAEVTATAGPTSAKVGVLVGGTLALQLARVAITPTTAPSGTCAIAGTELPIAVTVIANDFMNNPIQGLTVIFQATRVVDFACSVEFGEFCASGTRSTSAPTDAQGRATVFYTMLQPDVDRCNCLPSGSKCLPASGGKCSSPTCELPCASGGDQYCGVGFTATSGALSTTAPILLEYN